MFDTEHFIMTAFQNFAPPPAIPWRTSIHTSIVTQLNETNGAHQFDDGLASGTIRVFVGCVYRRQAHSRKVCIQRVRPAATSPDGGCTTSSLCAVSNSHSLCQCVLLL